jgi:hypothetical protein
MTPLELVKLLPLIERTAGRMGAASSVPALTSSVSGPRAKRSPLAEQVSLHPSLSEASHLLWSEFADRARHQASAAIIPPLLDALSASPVHAPQKIYRKQ